MKFRQATLLRHERTRLRRTVRRIPIGRKMITAIPSERIASQSVKTSQDSETHGQDDDKGDAASLA
jgi:hypothetical protein